MRAERKSPRTVDSYSEGVRGFLGWCADTGTIPELTRPTVAAFTTALLDAGHNPPLPAPGTWRYAGSPRG